MRLNTGAAVLHESVSCASGAAGVTGFLAFTNRLSAGWKPALQKRPEGESVVGSKFVCEEPAFQGLAQV